MRADAEPSDVIEAGEPHLGLRDSSDVNRWTDDLAWLVRRPTTWAVIAIGIAFRALVITSAFGELKADEAYAGLQAMEILAGRFSVVIPGAAYTAVIEPYLVAVVLAVVGGNVVVLKSLYVALWALAALVTFLTARRLLDRRGGAIAAALVWLAPGGLMILSTRAYVGYPIALTMITVTLWTCSWLLARDLPTAGRSALVGFSGGFAFFVHPMLLAVVVPMVLVPSAVYVRHVRRWWVPAVAGAVAANSVFLGWNALNGFPSLRNDAAAATTFGGRFVGFFTELLPSAFGLRSALGERYIQGDGGRVLPLAVHVVVALGLVALIAFGAAALVRLRGWRMSALVLVPVTVGWFLMAAMPSLWFTDDGRYGLVQFPFIVVLVAAAIVTSTEHLALARSGRRRDPIWRFGPAAIVSLWAVVLFLPYWWEATDGRFDRPNDDFVAVLEVLDDEGLAFVAGSFWRVLNLEFMSDRNVRAAVVGHPPTVRFPYSQRIVEAQDPGRVAYVFELWADDDWRLPRPVDTYERRIVADMVLYLPRD